MLLRPYIIRGNPLSALCLDKNVHRPKSAISIFFLEKNRQKHQIQIVKLILNLLQSELIVKSKRSFRLPFVHKKRYYENVSRRTLKKSTFNKGKTYLILRYRMFERVAAKNREYRNLWSKGFEEERVIIHRMRGFANQPQLLLFELSICFDD